MGSLLIFWAALSSFLALCLRRRIKDDPASFPLTAAFGLFVFAVCLNIHGFFLQVNDKYERTKAEEQAKEESKKTEQAKASSQYMKGIVDTWLEELSYSHVAEKAKEDESFRIVATGANIRFAIHQKKDRPGILVMETDATPSPDALFQLSRLSKALREKFFFDLRLELLRFEVDVAIIEKLHEKPPFLFIYLKHQFPYDQNKKGDMRRELMHLKMARELVHLFYEKLSKGMVS